MGNIKKGKFMRRILILLKNVMEIPKRLFSHIALFCILQDAVVDSTAAICSGVRFYRGKIGKYSYIGNNSFVCDTDIGNFTSISTDCYIGGTSHPIDWVSTSPVFHKWENIMKKNFARHEFNIFKRTYIGNDVWIGDSALVMDGVKIGDGAIIAAGAIVTKDVPDYAIVGGVPAKLIRYRFKEDEIDYLLNLKWWDKPESWIKENAEGFSDISSFVKQTK